MTQLLMLIKTLLNKEEGQALAEYGIILAFIAAVCVFALMALGGVIGVPYHDALAGFGGS